VSPFHVVKPPSTKADEDSDIEEPKKSGTSTPAVAAPVARAPARGKWADEDAEQEEEVSWPKAPKSRGEAKADNQDDWDVSDSEKAKPAAPAGAPAPVRKKKLKEKLAEKERALVSQPNSIRFVSQS
jgi:hypothetical protein